ncbi:MAG: hypothetical protein HQ483_14850 [Rhodospirillales bacterium]|nr:hypothetical protein [Rhodospirillales bacterium]
MTKDEFKATLTDASPQQSLSPLLQAMWYQAKGDWGRAHEIAQSQKGADGDWVHAFLHRDEGDLSNAGYWYRRAQKPVASGSVAAEWEQLVDAFLRG